MSQADFRKFEQKASSDAWDQQIGAGSAKATPKFDYIASTLTDKYSVKGLSYPQDLMDNPRYGSNRVIFYINTSVDSRVLKSGSEVATVEGVQRDMRGQLIGQKVSTAQAGVATGAVGAVKGAIGGSVVGGKGAAGAAIGGLVAGSGTALIAGSSNNAEVAPGEEKEPTFSRPQKRLNAAIALYIPNQLSARYSASWGEEDTAMFSAAAKGAGETARGLKGNAKGVAGEVLTALAIDKGQFGKEMGVAAGLASNPKKEQAFKNVDFRTFSFEYNFAPQSPDEAQNVLNIIRAFKYHMHPEFKSENAFLYIYPSEFDITYYKGNTENLNIHRHTSCVLTEVNVNYSPNGVFSTFDNGMPTQITLSLMFKELQLLSKETIEKYT
jgi:hypothetical protein